ncbi:hypothetical protein JDV02_007167 [Purpureocillium takamizusanense]|uniref:Uncharacterized protein n=1 Tax=Purpureocillium takamizusanense TaxID=2060973 RepID=A0A9Q8VDU4_9HYPO|nr:uncharacterized protein JDV02_007167 [Purpureocillium takamizusanense]UNI21152.1 hypothetical protein JDV02_007167 [Purpureocillium takamizusanense]
MYCPGSSPAGSKAAPKQHLLPCLVHVGSLSPGCFRCGRRPRSPAPPPPPPSSPRFPSLGMEQLWTCRQTMFFCKDAQHCVYHSLLGEPQHGTEHTYKPDHLRRA